MPRRQENAPVASDFMEAARSFGNYNLAFSLADLIDNSITAGANHIQISDDYEAQEIRVTDDGCGMTEKELIDNMRMGSRNPNAENDQNDLGRFGLGLKTASFAQARCLTVVSRKNGPITAARWDLDDVKDWQMYVFDGDEAIELVSDKFPEGNGTEIIWTKLNRLMEDGNISFSDFNSMMADAEQEISLVFHRYLSGELPHRPKLDISRNGRMLIAFDPFCQANISTHRKVTEEIEFFRNSKKTKIEITPFILPHYSNLSPSEDELLGGQEGYVKNQGFYIYREFRLIIRGTWFKLVPHGVFSNRARIRVDIPNSLDIDWKISVDKSEAELPWDLRLKLKNLLATWVIPDAIRVYTERKPRAKEQVRPVWNRHNSAAGVWHFSINRLHPLIVAFRGQLENFEKNDKKIGLIRKLNDILTLVENCLPLEPLKSLLEEKPQNVNGGYTDGQEIIDMAMALRQQLVPSQHTETYLIETLKTTVPFNEYHDQIVKHFSENPISN